MVTKKSKGSTGWRAGLLCLLAPAAVANDFGTTGLIDIPTAFMQPDGQFLVTIARDKRSKAQALTYQVTPWLESTFRYTGYNNGFWDRNYEVKLRLLEERYLVPQVSVGIRDLIGTGVVSAEYLVASKSLGQWQATAGIGWGRLAGDGAIRNPLTRLASSFETRPGFEGLGGEFNPDVYFSGKEVGFFGGVKYQFARWPVALMAQYNDDPYGGAGAEAPAESPISVGLEWQLAPGVELGLSRQHRDAWGFSLTSRLDSTALPARKPPPSFINAGYLPADELPPGLRRDSWYDLLLYDMERSGLLLIAGDITQQGSRADLVIGNTDYPLWADAIAQASALADLYLPLSVTSIHFILEEAGHATTTLVTPRVAQFEDRDRSMMARRQRILPGRLLTVPQHKTSFWRNQLDVTADLAVRTQLFDPDDPLRYQFYLKTGLTYQFTGHLKLVGELAFDIENNFDESARTESGSPLQHVRSDVVSYLQEGTNGMESLYLEQRDSVNGNLHYRLFGGVLEEMYSGLGGEVLYQRVHSRLAFGASLAYAKQRDYDRSFNHLDYSTVTGFVSAYWATPFYNYDVAVHAGRYLAEDVGATFEVRRTFANGWMVGAFATLTDVSAEDFGEGSFDKGFFFKIPFSLDGSRNSRNSFSTRMRVIQRDGGQRLDNFSGNLWWDVRTARHDALERAPERRLP